LQAFKKKTMEIFIVINNNVISELLLTFLIIKIYYCYLNDSTISNLISKYYENMKMNVVNIYKLDPTEKIKNAC
jgi:hypothetical protein